jgi:hypothetical protein
MKKFLLLPLLAVSLEAAHAQSIPAGTISLGGSIGYNSTHSDNNSLSGHYYASESETSGFNVTPASGYFIVDNLAIGVNLGYTYNKRTEATTNTNYPYDYTSKYTTKYENLQLGVFATYYKMLNEQFGFTGTLATGYQTYITHNSGTDSRQPGLSESESSGDGYYASLTPGVVFFPVPKFGLSASIGSLGFNHYNTDSHATGGYAFTDYGSSNSFSAAFGLSYFTFGGTFYLGR